MVGRLPAVGPTRKAGMLCFSATVIVVSLAGCGSSSTTSTAGQTATVATAAQATAAETAGLTTAAGCAFRQTTDGHGGPISGRGLQQLQRTEDPWRSTS